MLLDALDCEQAAGFTDKTNLLAAIIFSGANIPGESRKRMFKEINLELEHSELIRQGDVDGAAAHRFENSSLASQSVYGFLQQVGLVSPADIEETEDDS